VLAAAMRKKGRDAIGQVVFSGRQQLVRLRSVEGLLVMAMLDYAAEVQAPATVAAKLPSARAPAKSVQLAEMLVEAWAVKNFDIDAYKDTYRAQVKELIDAKVAGREIVAPEPEEQPQVINLMDALQKSLERNRPAPPKAKSRSHRRAAQKKKRRRAS
jgi:DNA end-binding protein Ku